MLTLQKRLHRFHALFRFRTVPYVRPCAGHVADQNPDIVRAKVGVKDNPGRGFHEVTFQ